MNIEAKILHTELLGQQSDHIHWLSDKVGIHHNMVNAYQEMQAAAKNQNIDLHIASGWRGFERQLQIWNNKFLARTNVKSIEGKVIDMTEFSELKKIKTILTFSALPGASRHHWGTDIDVYAPNLLSDKEKLQLEPWEYSDIGPFAPLNEWLKNNSQCFGFYFPYDCYRGGIAHEPWHLSYAPLADKYQQQFTVDLLANAIEKATIAGKSTILNHLDEIYQNYILNINQR
jgi:LAS superfamily LD-carboxypeptidase LdcB